MKGRAQSTGIANFFLALLVGAIMMWIITAITTPLLARADKEGGNTAAAQATEWFDIAIGVFPVLALFAGVFSLLALSVYLREILR